MSRAKLFKYLKYDRLTDKYCNEENSSGDCAACPVKTECDYYVNHDAPWLLEAYWFLKSAPSRIAESVSNFMAKHKKTHYCCSVCGTLEAPYFHNHEALRTSITYEYGWWKAKSSWRQTRWVCHDCMEHKRYALNADYTWEVDQKYIEQHNKNIKGLIQEKDPEYYEKWFGDEYDV